MHDGTSSVSTQAMPPSEAGAVTVRTRVCEAPLPQLAEHSDHGNQLLHAPSMGHAVLEQVDLSDRIGHAMPWPSCSVATVRDRCRVPAAQDAEHGCQACHSVTEQSMAHTSVLQTPISSVTGQLVPLPM